jgi:hypothetical protein
MLWKNDHTFTYVITGADIWIEQQVMAAALMRGGYDASGLDLEKVAAQAKVRDLEQTVKWHGIEVRGIAWGEPDYSGDVEVRLACKTENDLFGLKMVL